MAFFFVETECAQKQPAYIRRIETVRETLTQYVAQRTSTARLILNSTRLTQYTRHAVTASTHTIHKTCCHSTNSHNTQDMLPQHQLTQYTTHAATAPTQRNDVNH